MPQRAGTSDLRVLALGIGAAALLSLLSFIMAPDDSAAGISGSSFAADAKGAKAAFLLLEARGHGISPSFEPVANLRIDPERTILVVADPEREPSAQDRRALTEFVTAGGIVVATGPTASAFLPDLSFRRANAIMPGEQPALSKYRASFPSTLSAGVTEIEMDVPSGGAALGAAWLPIFGSMRDPAIALRRIGQGRIIWWVSSHPLTNQGIDRAGHVELLLNSIEGYGPRTILWDEFYHGHARSLWSYIAATPLAWGVAQCGLLAAVVFVTRGRRRGPIRDRSSPPRTSPMEFVETIATLYQRAGASAAAVDTALTRARRLLTIKAALPRGRSDAALILALKGRPGVDVEAAAALLERAAGAAKDYSLQDAEALSLVRGLHDLEQAIEHGRSRRRSQRPDDGGDSTR